jgi:hypothetical protein
MFHAHVGSGRWHSIDTQHREGFAPERHTNELRQQAREKLAQAYQQDKERKITVRYSKGCRVCGNLLEAHEAEAFYNIVTGELRCLTCPIDGKQSAIRRVLDPTPAAPAVPTQAKDLRVEALTSRVESIERDIGVTRELVVAVKKADGERERQLAELDKKLNSARRVEVALTTTSTNGTTKKVVKKLGRQHEHFERFLRYASMRRSDGKRLNVSLIGTAGSGKTTAGHMLANALGLKFWRFPVGFQTSKTDIFGYQDASGKYIPSIPYHAVTKGGVLLFDEMDTANPQALTYLHSFTDNGLIGFPTGMVEKHPNCIIVSAMNTFGRGADMMFVGRAQLDAATLDRWTKLEWDIDWSFARELAGNDEWTSYVQALSESAIRQQVRVIIGPRAAIEGAWMLSCKEPRAEVEQVKIWAGVKIDDRQKIIAGLPAEMRQDNAS